MDSERTEILEALIDSGGSATLEHLAAQLPYTAAQLTRHLQLLAGDDIVTLDADAVALTDTGRVQAWRAVRRHRLTLLLLTEMIGLPWSDAHHLSAAWEPLVDEQLQDHIYQHLDQPTLCPYGHPLDPDTLPPAGVPLEAAPDGPARVVSLNPRLVAEREALEILQRCGARPGDDIEIRSRADGWLEVAGTIRDAALPPTIARNLTVAPFTTEQGRPLR
jgi:DtxR family transcriptional regulator, Mn-dependent transcriptional regulator